MKKVKGYRAPNTTVEPEPSNGKRARILTEASVDWVSKGMVTPV